MGKVTTMLKLSMANKAEGIHFYSPKTGASQ